MPGFIEQGFQRHVDELERTHQVLLDQLRTALKIAPDETERQRLREQMAKATQDFKQRCRDARKCLF